MKQFTSHIDFSLTKKRFKMMFKEFSPIRSGSKGMLLVPVLLIMTMMFCSRQPDYPIKITDNSDVLYSTVDLYMNPPKSRELNIKKRGMGIRYDSEGNPFTGTQELRFVKNDSLFAKTVFENGITKNVSAYFKDGDSTNQYSYEYGYIGEHFKVVKHYRDGLLMEEWKDAAPNELGYHKQWHANGKLKYEAYFEDNIEYEDLMTLYDEEGNIIEQERYENGILIEKIK